jgi:hypothetical protein
MTVDQEHRAALEREIHILESKLQPQGTGSIHTAIHVLKWRVDELKAEAS